MKKTYLLLVFIVFLFSGLLQAQTEKSYVVNAGAGNIEKGNFNVTYFIGDHIGYDTPNELLLNTRLGEITIFPNPVNTILNLKTSIPDLDKIQIFNVNGVKIHQAPLINSKIDFSGFPDGIYLMKILDKQNEDVGSVKLIKN